MQRLSDLVTFSRDLEFQLSGPLHDGVCGLDAPATV